MDWVPINRRDAALPKKTRRSSHPRFTIFLVVIAMAFVGPSFARNIFLNGVNIDTVRNQDFDNVQVRVDQSGNIYISAPQYTVHHEGGAKSSTRTPSAALINELGERYWLISEENYPGKAQYDVDVVINGTWIKTISSGSPQVILEISRFLRSGENKVQFIATKKISAERLSDSSNHYLKVYIGTGDEKDGGNLFLTNPMIEYQRNAAEVKNFHNVFQLIAE